MSNRVSVLDVSIDTVTMDQAIAKIERFITEKKTHLIATANAEMVMMAQRDPDLKRVLAEADLVVPDGAGVVWAARHMGFDMPERVAGYDLVQKLLEKAAIVNYKVYMLGAAPDVIAKAKFNAEQRFPGLRIVGFRDGYFNCDEDEKVIQNILDCRPDILLVALGVPKQEKWLGRYLDNLRVPVAIGVGGTFDVMAGVVSRAPLWMQNAKLEWLFRLMRQPKRALRMLVLPHFVIKVMAVKKY